MTKKKDSAEKAIPGPEVPRIWWAILGLNQ